MKKCPLSIIYIIILCSVAYNIAGGKMIIAKAETISELQDKIDQRNRDMANLEKEIKSYQKQIDSLSSQASSLSSTIKSLDLTRKKLEANISLTQDKITAKNYEIQKLDSQITNKEGKIQDDIRIISRSFVEIDQMSDQSLVEMLLKSDSLAQAWNSMDELGIIQKSLRDRVVKLSEDKADLEYNKTSSEKAKAELLALNNQLGDEKKIVLSTKAEKDTLLKETKQSEASYKEILAAKKAREVAIQKEIDIYESQLNLLINPSSIPQAGSGILSWPLDNIKITQYFGNTSFATANPQIYKSGSHPGIDLRASIGTAVKASLSGVVTAVYDADINSSCSYGKWIMVKHTNGLSTLYGHLSLQKVSIGQNVSTGQLLGYSGNTGISTGPHLHFGVYATEGILIRKFTESIYCKNSMIPFADPSAKLNPLSYLPSI
jgi:murein DD-endopeptidase MepM/ murein hydrolase activator NlpD